MCDRLWVGCLVATLVVVLGVSAEPAAAQANYTYTVIDDTSNCYNVGTPALGNNGDAAFIANCGLDRVVRKGEGVTSTDIYTYRGVLGDLYSIPDSIVSINDLESWRLAADRRAAAAPATRFSTAMAAR